MSAARTSHTHPLQIAEVRAAPAQGRIGITFCPGKHDRSAHTGAWARDLAVDLDAIAAWGARLVLTLVEPHELAALQVPQLGAEVQRRGMEVVNCGHVLHGTVAELVRGAVAKAALHSCACQPDGEAARVVVAPAQIGRAHV